jgi:hypothetical protein
MACASLVRTPLASTKKDTVREYNRLLFLLLLTTLSLAVGVATASATRLAINNTQWRIVWKETKPFSVKELGFAGAVIRCRLTLEGSFHSHTISKGSGQLIGAVTRAIAGESTCTGGQMRTLSEKLPWHVKFVSFIGALPAISNIRIALVGVQMLVEAFGFVSCLYTTSDPHAAFGDLSRDKNDGNNIADTASGRIPSNTAFCPEGEFSGSSEPAKNETETTTLSISLVA